MRNKTNKINQNKITWYTLAICFFMVIIAESFFISAPWICDAGDYWLRGEQLKSSGCDLNSIDGFRGYVFPLFLGIVNYFGGKKCCRQFVL